MKTLYAEDINYWKTGKTDPDTWLERTAKVIGGLGGKILSTVYGSEPGSGRAAYMVEFQFGEDRFKAIWPVLKSRSGNDRAARIQAATMLYHDVKARLLAAAVLGPRAAFLTYLLLPDGRTAAQAATPDLAVMLPALFAPPERPMLKSGDFVEGEYTER